ncbi:MAG: DNA-binding response regulator [Planctomyces sp.]|nr:DNA-binding response regulator [Planctomyces sp.]
MDTLLISDRNHPDMSPDSEFPPTVFVIDDDMGFAESAKYLIESIHKPVVVFPSADEYLAQFDPRQTGCIVSDVRMPGMSGLELQEILRERNCLLPIIIVSAFGDVPIAVRAMKAGAIHVLKKPFDDNDFLELIQKGLSEDARRREEFRSQQVVLDRYDRLTDREREVFEEVIEGLSSKEIGQRLSVSFKTIEAHRAKIMKKMEADSIPQLLRMWFTIQQCRVTKTILPPQP